MSSLSRRLWLGALATTLLATLIGVTTASAESAQSVRLKYRTTAPAASYFQVEPWFDLVNTSASPLQLDKIKIRYYFKADSPTAEYEFACSWAMIGCSYVTGTFVRQTALDRYLEVGFTPRTLAPGANTADLQLRFHRTNWQYLNQSDDYSFGPGQSSYADWTRVTVHRNGQRIWGTPPGGVDPTPSPTPTVTPPTGQVLFDDFAYAGSDDPAIAARKWSVRTNAGGPGVPGASWPKENVTFPTVNGNKVMQLKAVTDGTAAGTSQSEMLHQRKFFEGTYAARVKFTDAPLSGPDGDEIVQTFFTITPLNSDLDPDYGELDFEYLPNGGWGLQGPLMYMTSWETYRPDPWLADSTSTFVNSSHAGWHDLLVQVSGGEIKYYIDGVLAAEHGGKYYPETPMSINFNLWFITGGQTGSTRSYVQQVDWVYHAKNEVVSPAEVGNRVTAYRASATTFKDTVPNP